MSIEIYKGLFYDDCKRNDAIKITERRPTMNIEKIEKVRVDDAYAMTLSDADSLNAVFKEKGFDWAILMAYKAGWESHQRKTRNDARRKTTG